MAAPLVIFFDVGNTLLFPNRDKMLAPISKDRRPTLEEWQAIERVTKIEFDRGMQTGAADHGFWWMFHTRLLDQLGEDQRLRETLVVNTRNSANWDQIVPGTRDALQRICQKFRIAVISNSDGAIDRVLAKCRIADCFESITDSGVVGFEKPRREIFDAALKRMNAQAEACLYIGDVYSVDYAGARNVGMDAVLFDVAGAYRDRDLPRVRSLAELQGFLEKYRP